MNYFRQKVANSKDNSPGKDSGTIGIQFCILFYFIQTKLTYSGFASPSATNRDVPIMPEGAAFQPIYDEITGEPTHLYYPDYDITLPIGYLQ